MIQLMFIVILSEMALILAFLFRTPFRKLVVLGLDQIKRGRGPIVVKTVAGTVLVALMTSVYSIIKIKNSRIDKAAIVSLTDQVLMVKHLLEATLMGNFSIFNLFFWVQLLQLYGKSCFLFCGIL